MKYYFKKYKTVEKALLVTAENNNTNLVKENKTDDDIIKYVMSLNGFIELGFEGQFKVYDRYKEIAELVKKSLDENK